MHLSKIFLAVIAIVIFMIANASPVLAASSQWRPVCQWCGKQGSIASGSGEQMPSYQARISGYCLSHPSGKPKMQHNAQWVRIK